MRPEAKVQLKVCEYLQENYPDVIFHSDLSSGAVLPIGAAMMNKRLQFSTGLPDVYIFEARQGFHGLVLELKADGITVFKKDGTLRKDDHLAEQATILQGFRERGWRAEFAIGLDAAKIIINDYLFPKLYVYEDSNPRSENNLHRLYMGEPEIITPTLRPLT